MLVKMEIFDRAFIGHASAKEYSLHCEFTFRVVPGRCYEVPGSCILKQNAQFPPSQKVFIPQCRVSPSRGRSLYVSNSPLMCLEERINRLINKNHRHIVSCSSKAIYGSCLWLRRNSTFKSRIPLTICLHAANTESQSAEMPLVIKDAEADLVSANSVREPEFHQWPCGD